MYTQHFYISYIFRNVELWSFPKTHVIYVTINDYFELIKYFKYPQY